jgi:DNA-binding NarL/FixJ family response regulator
VRPSIRASSWATSSSHATSTGSALHAASTCCAAERPCRWRYTARKARRPLPRDLTARVVIRDLADDGAIAAALAERFDVQPTIVTVADPSAQTSRALLLAGARGVIGRDAAREDLDAAVAAVARGYIVLSDRREPLAETGGQTLTPRERDVLAMLARGLSNKNIAARLSLAENTVKFHVASILAKLDATTRTQAVTIGVRRGWIML